MIKAIICARSFPQARSFANDALGLQEFGRFLQNAVVVTRDDQSGGANACVMGLDTGKPFYVIGGPDVERACAETIHYLTSKGHQRQPVDPTWER